MKKQLLLVFCIFIFVVPAFAQNTVEKPAAPLSTGEDFWICPGFETALYSPSGMAFGGSLALGYGKGLSIGLKAAYFFSSDNAALELGFLLRCYLRGADAYSGPFLQFAGGNVLFTDSAKVGFPSTWGSISAGLAFGWRFLFRDRWFVEPAIRAGYPYIVGAGVSGGIRF